MELNFNNILFLTSFCFMACDGSIANKEIELLRKLSNEDHLFGDIKIDEQLDEYTKQLERMGNSFVHSYLEALADASFTKEQEILLLKVAIDTIYADEIVEYSEIKFFKAVKERLNLSDEEILSNIPSIEDYWLERDINEGIAEDSFMQSVDLSNFTIET